MQIEINGKRNITLDFNAPKKFRLVKDGAEIPYIRTGKNSFRLSKPVDGFVELEEIVEKPRYMQPVQLQPQQMTVINPQDVDRLNEAVRQMALVNPQDVMIINQTAEQLEQNQNFIAQTQKEITDNQVYIDQQQQRLNETALGIQALETDNSQRLDGAENAILNLAGEISNAQNMAVDGMNTALNKIEEQGILLQAEIDTKADKDELESLKKDFEEKSDRISSAMSNYSGGTAYDTLPQGGEAGQILAKRTDRQGDYIWINQTPVIVKSETIPTASEKYKGEVYQYVGETGDYTHGYIYECQQNGTSYNWVRLDVQPNTAVWGQITGTLSDQTDLQDALNLKANKSYVDSQDNNLQQQIDAITAASDVTDVVGTYAQLQAYDTSSLPNNSIIKVLQDESRNDETTYYRWVITAGVGAWVLIGEEGPYYTKAESDATFQEKLVSGTNIKTINNNSILGSGNVDIDALPSQTGQSGKFLTTNGTTASWAEASVTPDNKSITKNTSDELQTVGVIDSNNTTNAIKTWTGTRAQYDAIQNKDPNTLYNITDSGEIYLGNTLLSNYGADTSLSNLTSTGKNIANWSNNVTNCITEIPQDIKLELNNGTLTLKAGSKVYVPNGAGVFDVVTIASDITGGAGSGDDFFFLVSPSGTYFGGTAPSKCYSGTTAPSNPTNNDFWYDTTNNIIKRYVSSSTSWTSGWSFPVCLSNNTIIKQVFNGFGYIGSTVFALPGVKGLIPNGRNADGSLKSVEFTIDSVKTVTRTWIDGDSRQCWGYIKNPPSGTSETWYWNSFIESETEPSNTGYCMWYKPSENITYMNNQDGATNWQKVSYIDFGKASGINSKEVKIFTPKTAFHALDYNDSSTISGWSMPSSRYINLTLGASGATYTAPANGWFVLNKAHGANTNTEIITMENFCGGSSQWIDGLIKRSSLNLSGVSDGIFIPAKKGDVVQILYTYSGQTNAFRFYYAEGEA